MNKVLQDKLTSLEGLIQTQKNCVNPYSSGWEYMHGMANGMILAHSIFADTTPEFQTIKIRKHKIRHKSKK